MKPLYENVYEVCGKAGVEDKDKTFLRSAVYIANSISQDWVFDGTEDYLKNRIDILTDGSGGIKIPHEDMWIETYFDFIKDGSLNENYRMGNHVRKFSHRGEDYLAFCINSCPDKPGAKPRISFTMVKFVEGEAKWFMEIPRSSLKFGNLAKFERKDSAEFDVLLDEFFPYHRKFVNQELCIISLGEDQKNCPMHVPVFVKDEIEQFFMWSDFSLRFLYLINSPCTYVLRTRRVIKKGKNFYGGKFHIKKKKVKLLEKYTVIKKEHIKYINPEINKSNLHTPHNRRGHWRRLTGRTHKGKWIEYSKENTINGKIWIDELWVGPKNWIYGGMVYSLQNKRGVQYNDDH